MAQLAQPLAVPVRRAWHFTTEHLYPLLALATLAVLAGLMPLPPHDFWWHLRAGQIIAETGHIPTTNIWAWSLPADTPFVYGAWLGEWLLYRIYRLGSLELVVFTRNLLALVAWGIVGLEAWYRCRSWKVAALVLALAELMTLNNLIVRPQNWSWVPFALFVLILGRYAAGQWSSRVLVVLPLVMVFWVNVHGAFVLGIALLGLWAVGETLRTMLRQPNALNRRRLGALYFAGVGVAVATFINPQGWGIWRYVLNLLGDQGVQGLVSEWQAPTPHGIANSLFFGSVLVLLVAWAWSRHRPSITDVLVVCALLWLAWGGQRHVVWWGMAAMPILAQTLHAPPTALTPTRRRRPRQLPMLNAVLAAFVVVPVVTVQPWFVRALPLSDGYQKQVLPAPAPPLLGVETPYDAAAWLKGHPGGKLWNDMGYGSYLAWAVPEQQVFIDPRIELYKLAQWQDYIAIGDGRLDVLAKYGINRILLSREAQPKLSAALGAAQGWRREYQDAWSEVWTSDE